MKQKLLKAMQSKTFWMSFMALVGGILIQLGLIDLGQQFNAIMGLVITFLVAIGLVHDNSTNEYENKEVE